MKKILSPTDFSRASQKTLPYLREFYRRFQADITLLHTFQVRTTASTFIRMDNIMEEDAIRRMEKWKTELAKGLDSEERIHSVVTKGNMVDVFSRMVGKEPFDLSVFGTSGVSGFLEMVEGSFTNKVLKKTVIPLLAIPEDYDYKPLETVVLAVDDLKFKSVKTIQPLIDIVRAWESNLWVYHKDTGDQSAPVLDAELSGLSSVRYFHEPAGQGSVLESILNFCQEQDAGLLCMIRHKQTLVEKSFNISTTSQSLFSAMLPMLFLQNPDS